MKPPPLSPVEPAALVVPSRPPESVPAWRRYAALAPELGGRVPVALVVDDVGLNRQAAARVIALAAPVTISLLPYADGVGALAAAARAAGHEVMLHLPMEPEDRRHDPGPHALLMSLDEGELLRRLDWNLARLGGFVGVNNHMGSLFTADRRRMTLVMREIRARGLLWLDSMTSHRSVGRVVADAMGVPAAARDVFLDNDDDAGSVAVELRRLEETALKHGQAIGIGHPHDRTIHLIGQWLQGARARGFEPVPISLIVARRLATG